MKIKAKFTTAVSFWEKITTYVPGEGPTVTWQLYTEGAMSVFPCEWRGNFMSGFNRNETYLGDAEGVRERASIRMPYVPGLYMKLRTGSVVAVKGADESAIVDGEPPISILIRFLPGLTTSMKKTSICTFMCNGMR